MKTILKSGQECFLVGTAFPGKGGQYQKVQVRKNAVRPAFPPTRMMGYSPNERAEAYRTIKPYPSTMHELIVKSENIKQVKEKAFVG